MAACLIASAIVGCQKHAEDVTVLAEVNGQPITEASFLYWQKESGLPSTQLLDQLIDRSAMVQLAREMGLDRDPGLVAEMESVLIAKLREQEVLEVLAQQGEVSETEILQYYEAHRESFLQAPRLSVAVLWFDTRGQSPLEARYRPMLEEARAAYLQQSSPGERNGFGDLARTHSEHTATRYKGGELGWLEKDGNYNPWTDRLLQIANELADGDLVSEVVVNELGSFLVAVLDRESARLRPVESVKDRIKSAIRQARREEVAAAFQTKITQSSRVVKYPERLNAFTEINVPVDSNQPPAIPQ